MAINKVEYYGNTLVDLTGTTATADKILTGYGAYGADGEWMDGTATGGETGIMKAVGARLQLGIDYSARNSSVLDTEVEDGTISVYFYMDQDSATGYVQGSHNNSSWTTLYSRNTDGARSVTTYSGYRYYRLRISGTKTSGNWLVGTMTCIVSGTESANAFNPEEEVI